MAGKAEAMWEAARALYAGDAVTFESLAAVSGRPVRSIARRAAREHWRRAESTELALRERLREMLERLLARLETALDGLKDGPAGTEKLQFEIMSLMSRTAEKIGEFTRHGDGAKEKKKTDAEKRAILKRIDTRIFQLAEEIAKGMGPRKPDA